MKPVDVLSDPKPKARRRDPDLMRLLHLDPQPCAMCGRADAAMHLHHILPRARRGDDARENLAWLDPDCHRAVHSGEEIPVLLNVDGNPIWNPLAPSYRMRYNDSRV